MVPNGNTITSPKCKARLEFIWLRLNKAGPYFFVATVLADAASREVRVAFKLPSLKARSRTCLLSMLAFIGRHWRHYLAEAGGLAFFMLGASTITTQLRYKEAWLHGVITDPFAQLATLGLLMSFVVAIIIYNPWGNKSGAHINPAVTIAMWRLGKIDTHDALFYIASQFAGAVAAVQVAGLILGKGYTKAGTNYVVTQPGEAGATAAFIAEWIISFVLMMVTLWALNNAKREKFAGLMIAILIGFYLVVEEPYSGMSLNPARSFASAFAARDWKDLWTYFVAPITATLAAAELFRAITGGAPDLAAHPQDSEEQQRDNTPTEEANEKS